MLVMPARLNNGQYAWWLAEDTGIRSIPAHLTCSHRRYRLTCAQFEALTRRAGGDCEVCGKPGHLLRRLRQKGHHTGRLHLDHDHSLGLWAVRGLLCGRCNTTIDRPERSAALTAYDASAFYRSVLSHHGVALAGPPEPRVGAVAFDFAYRPWARTDDGWKALHKYARNMAEHVTWAELIFDSGPHNLRLQRTAACM